MKKWMSYFTWALLSATLLLTLSFSRNKQAKKACSEIHIEIDHNSGNFFIVEDDINAMVYHEMDTVIGRPIADIKTERLEHKISNHPSIASSEVYKTIDGHLIIEVKQRKPIVRLYNMQGESFYLDNKGNPMPISEQYTSRVIIANGFIFDSFVDAQRTKQSPNNDSLKHSHLIEDIFTFAEYINRNEFWAAQIEQLYVNKEFDIELIPRVGNHRIVFGDATSIEDKFDKLKIFYHEGLSKTGWNEYSVINLKYANQVVCKKRK